MISLRRSRLEDGRRFVGARDYAIVADRTFAMSSPHALRAEDSDARRTPRNFLHVRGHASSYVTILRLSNWRAAESNLILTRRARP